MKTIRIQTLAVIVFVFLLAACSRQVNQNADIPGSDVPGNTAVQPVLEATDQVSTPTTIPVPTPIETPLPDLSEFPRRVDIGTHSLYINCIGEGKPTVILEAGMGDSSLVWDDVMPAIAEFTQVCAYDRASLGKSDRAPQLPRTSLDIAEDLHLLLESANVSGPYILIGHSIAGLHVRVFAHRYPSEVAGLILVDANNPNLFDRFLNALPAKSSNEEPGIRETREFFSGFPDKPSMNPEKLDVRASMELVQGIGTIGDLPLIVIAADRGHSTYSLSPLPKEIKTAFENIWQELQKELASLSSNSILIVADSGHYIQRSQPQIMIDEVHRMVEMLQDN